MRSLPASAQVFIAVVIAAGVAVLAWTLPHVRFDNALLFLALMLMSNLTSAFKVTLLAASGSTLSVSYMVDFAALLLLGPAPTTLIAVTSAWSQCTFRMKQPTPWYRTLFSMASLAITVRAPLRTTVCFVSEASRVAASYRSLCTTAVVIPSKRAASAG